LSRGEYGGFYSTVAPSIRDFIFSLLTLKKSVSGEYASGDVNFVIDPVMEPAVP